VRPFFDTAAAELGARYWLANAQVPAALLEARASGSGVQAPASGSAAQARASGNVGLLLDGAQILAVAPQPSGPEPIFDLAGATVFSAFVDPHTHLDKGDLLAAGLGAERDLMTAVHRVRADYPRWSETELRTRIAFALRTAFAHGTRALNSYCDWPQAEAPLAWHVLQGLRREWAGRVELRLTALLPIDALADAQHAQTIGRGVTAGGGTLGWFVYPGAPVQLLPRAFDLAERFDLRLDFHIDEHLDPPHANLPLVAQLARERGYGARTVCGHCCVLGTLPVPEQDALLDAVAGAGISLVALPFTNLYLQDSASDAARGGARRSPRRRGLLPVHEARARGIPLAFGSDNHRDPFFPGGDLDPLQTLGLAALAAQLDAPVADWADTVTRGPARLLHLAWDGVLRAGAPADLVIHPGRSSAEVISRAAHGRVVLRAGRRVAAVLPDFRELDGLRE
jgi:cytosine/creatinine deaminase